MKDPNSIGWEIFASLVFIALILVAWHAEAQESISSSLGLIVYPSKGQSAQQQNKDEGECYLRVEQETGIDPVAVASVPTQQQANASSIQRFNSRFGTCMESRGYAIK